ncbi:regulatory protein [Consotaella salsifontis]|uniref:Regulatory protein RecX n=2 Tax=Consotaella salsifontis TaxID=1365950 RepID=A0A1T4NLB0_9HYPH|nr:regulatory protein [Consotaella salsifontis]
MRASSTYLSRYASSSDNLRKVLRRKLVRRLAGETAAVSDEHAALVDSVVASFVELGLLDDEAYAEARLNSLRRRGAPSRQIAAKLANRGVDAETVARAIAADPVSDRQAALRYAQRRRLGPFRIRDRAERRERDLAAMVRAGFSLADALAAIDATDDPTD